LFDTTVWGGIIKYIWRVFLCVYCIAIMFYIGSIIFQSGAMRNAIVLQVYFMVLLFLLFLGNFNKNDFFFSSKPLFTF